MGLASLNEKLADQQSNWVTLFKESVIFQGLLATLCIIGTFALLLLDKPIPDYVWILDATAVGFFFGARNLMSARNGAKEMAAIADTLAVQNAQIVQAISTMGIGGAVGVGLRGGVAGAHDEKPVGWTG